MQCSVSDPNIVYVSTSTLLETQGTVTLKEISSYTYEEIEKIAVGVIDIVDPPRLGFQLTLGIHLNNMPRRKGKLNNWPKVHKKKLVEVDPKPNTSYLVLFQLQKQLKSLQGFLKYKR